MSTDLGPIGLRPRHIAAGFRCEEIEEAMARYQAVDKSIPEAWTEELADLDAHAKGWRPSAIPARRAAA